MSDERLLSEALRAHAAGGVSTPRADASAPPAGSPGTDVGSEGPPSGRRRFRPLGRVRRPEQPAPADRAPTEQAPSDRPRPDPQRADPQRADPQRADPPTARTDVPSPRSGGPGLPPPGYARGPVLPAPPTTPVRPGPASGGFGAAGPTRPGPTGRPGTPRPVPADAGASGSVAWSAVTVTWWSLVAILAGGVVGGAVGVLSLLLPA